MANILETKRLILREMTQADYPALAAIMRDEQTMYAYEGPFSVTETMEWLDKQIKRYQADKFGLWAVELQAIGEMIGQTGVTWQDLDGRQVPEIGYLFNRAYWGHGYATEAAIACREYAFTTLGLQEVYSIIRDTNLASINVAIRNGMLARTRIVKHYRGVDMPHLAFSVKREEAYS
jgi:RimJ/RimL family protein N-acetyltransferase